MAEIITCNNCTIPAIVTIIAAPRKVWIFTRDDGKMSYCAEHLRDWCIGQVMWYNSNFKIKTTI